MRIVTMARSLEQSLAGPQQIDGPRIHRAGRLASARKGLMAGAFAFTGLLGAATLAIGVMDLTGPFSDSDRSLAAVDSVILPLADGPEDAAVLAAPWDGAALGLDSANQTDLLRQPISLILEVAPGDTLMTLLTRSDVDRQTAYDLVQSLSTVFNPRGLKPGQRFELTLMPAADDDAPAVEGLWFRPDPLRDIVVTLGPQGYETVENVRALTNHTVRADGSIDSSLFIAARDVGVPLPVLGDLIHIFSFDIDFQREVQPGDRFSLMFSERRTEAGEIVDFGEILLAEMTVNGTVRRFYRFVDNDGRVDYYDVKGRSVHRALLRTPIDGARLSSGYGKRKHPILGYTRMHRGADFAAPPGTPIYAAGDGVVEAAGWNGGYGRYIRIRHGGTYSTAYAHLSRIDSRVKPGARVTQRQIIGYVGSSGRSTGPHLHYEVLVNGSQVNPLSVKLPTGKELRGVELARFELARAEIDGQYAAVEPRTQVATLQD